MIVLRFLLYPFAVLYNLITGLRNRLYDLGYKPSVEFDLPVISVGNLAVGGTGKTPLVEHLIRLLSPTHQVATLSRGYGRSTKGFRLAGGTDTAATMGDEPMQFYRKFRGKAVVSVGEERALAITMLADEFPDLGVIILDDAFQHRPVKPEFSILLTDYRNPFYNDLLLPAGRLRESRRGARRADVVVVTKCPHGIQDEEMLAMEHEIRRYSDKPVFFAGIHYGEPLPFSHTRGNIRESVILVSGIANSGALEEYVTQNFRVAKHFNFADHHAYTPADVQVIASHARQHQACVLTTEKDSVKLDCQEFGTILSGVDSFYIPIEPEFVKGGREFDEMILNAVKQAQHKKNVHSES